MLESFRVRTSVYDSSPLIQPTEPVSGIFQKVHQLNWPIRLIGMKIPHPDEESVEFFRSLVPDDPHVTVRPMFGNISAFVNGNMFFGVFGNDLFLRLSSEDHLELFKNKGASVLEPMKGKPMRDYVVIPKNWRDRPDTVRSWISKALEWSSKLPPKKTKK
jgi:TfoX/Sxy family transcriptional regulator of competence genes